MSAHPLLVRITHWLTTLSVAGLLLSGGGILLAHPRLYWGTTGAVGTPSLIDFPLPFMIGGPSGWGRYLHFLSAWLCVAVGIVYGIFTVATRRLGSRETTTEYTAIQRLTYLVVVFVLFPAIIWTGLAMSPALAALWPPIVMVLGGQQSARTIHFFLAVWILTFAIGHVAMVSGSGFGSRIRRMLW